MGRVAVATAVSWWLIPISILVNRIFHGPYMDEIFHVPQAQKYCRGNFRSWDPMITTPPGSSSSSFQAIVEEQNFLFLSVHCGVNNLLSFCENFQHCSSISPCRQLILSLLSLAKVINYHWSTKYLMVPLYVYSMFSILTNLAKGQKKIWLLVYILACAGTLIPTPLIEFRYYTVSFYFLILHTRIDDNKSWLILGTIYLAINCFTMFMFLFDHFLGAVKLGTEIYVVKSSPINRESIFFCCSRDSSFKILRFG